MLADESLMESFVTGTEESFDEIVSRYASRVTNFIYRQVCDFSTAQDLAQETFLAVYRKKHTYKQGYSFSSWLYKIAMNFCRMHFRKGKSAPATLSIDESMEEGRVGLGAAVVDQGENPFDALNRSDLEGKLRSAIAELPTKQRLVFTLSFYEGRTYDEIARLLGCSPGTVASRKHTAVKRLASKLRRLAPEMVGFVSEEHVVPPCREPQGTDFPST